MNSDQFAHCVAQAFDELPPALRRELSNVAIVVEELADDDVLDQADVDDPMDLYGFYIGVPLTARGSSYGLIAPDKISIYRRPIVAVCANDTAIKQMIRKTLRHELAHYFGIDDDRLEELDAY